MSGLKRHTRTESRALRKRRTRRYIVGTAKLLLFCTFSLLVVRWFSTERVTCNEYHDDANNIIRVSLNSEELEPCLLFSIIVTWGGEHVSKISRLFDGLDRSGFRIRFDVVVVYDDSSDTQALLEFAFKLQTNSWYVSWSSSSKDVPELARATKTQCQPRAVRFIYNDRRGRASAQNLGIMYSSALYVWPISSVHFVHPSFIERLFEELRMRNTDLASKRFNIIAMGLSDSDGKLLPQQPTAMHANINILERNPLYCCALILRSTFEMLRYDEAFVFGWEDWDFSINVEYRIGIREILIPGTWYVYSTCDGSKTCVSPCAVNDDICKAILHIANHDKYAKQVVHAALRTLKKTSNIKEIITHENWKIMESLAKDKANHPLAHFLVCLVSSHKQSTESLCTEVVHEPYRILAGCQVGAVSGKQSAIIRTSSDLIKFARRNSHTPLYHHIVTKCADYSSRLHQHSMTSILQMEPNATILVHLDINSLHCVDEEFVQHYSPRIQRTSIDYRDLAERCNRSNSAHALSAASKHKYFYSHVTDLRRFLLLYLIGGTYLDTDVILVRRPEQGNIAKQSDTGLNGAFLSFPSGHPFVAACLDEIPRTYDPNSWGSVGPALLDAIMSLAHIFDASAITVLEKSSFYSFPWEDHYHMFVSPIRPEDFKSDGIYGYHLWASLSSPRTVIKGSVWHRALASTCLSSIGVPQDCLVC